MTFILSILLFLQAGAATIIRSGPATPSSGGGAIGNFFIKNADAPYWWNGSAWVALSGGGGGTVTSITATTPLTGGTITTSGSIGCQTASGAQAGCLSSTDWTTFNSKESALTFNSPLSRSTNTISLPISAASRLLGRGDSGAGDAQEISLGAGLSMSGTTLSASGTGGTVTTTGSPASGNLTKFSGSTSITNGDLSGDVTTSGALTTTIANSAVTYAKMQNVSANSKLLGSGSSGSGSPPAEITLGSGLSMSGTTISTTGGGSGTVDIKSWVQSKSNNNIGTTDAITLGAAPTNGNYLLGFIGALGRGANSITQTNVTWTQLTTYNGNGNWVEVWTGVCSTSCGTTATANFTGSNTNFFSIVEHTIANFSTVTDRQTYTVASDGISVLPALSTSAGDYVVGACYTRANGAFYANMPFSVAVTTLQPLHTTFLVSVGGPVWFQYYSNSAQNMACISFIIS